ncbi:MAG: DUF1559 domain-containing protein [Planctomycetales bacterium]|nr:DUF1559 domain-containing protein [Planctomycetales bacterium]
MNRILLTIACSTTAIIPLGRALDCSISIASAEESNEAKARREELEKREAAAFAHSRNSLRQLMLAMHNHHDTHRRLPAAYSRKEDGTKLLSWRVHLLPFLGEAALHSQFHLDEPWDSEHNKALIAKIPTVFVSPSLGDDAAKKGLTVFVAPIAPKTIFEGSEAIPFSKIRDGLSNTLGFLEADSEHAVVWTKPEDLSVDWKEPLKGLKLRKVETGSVFLTVFCDGKIQAISNKIEPAVLRRLLQKNDGEAIGIIP